MEHRYSDRSETDLKIVIYKQNLLVAMGIIRNIGNEGVFVETRFNEVPVNQPLEIEFFSHDTKALKDRRFKAMVVHRSNAGFGAEIDDTYAKIRLSMLRNRSNIASFKSRYGN
jgi:uncharacterized GH25 family protein